MIILETIQRKTHHHSRLKMWFSSFLPDTFHTSFFCEVSFLCIWPCGAWWRTEGKLFHWCGEGQVSVFVGSHNTHTHSPSHSMWRKMELHRAARKGESEKLQRLLDRGSYDVNLVTLELLFERMRRMHLFSANQMKLTCASKSLGCMVQSQSTPWVTHLLWILIECLR